VVEFLPPLPDEPYDAPPLPDDEPPPLPPPLPEDESLNAAPPLPLEDVEMDVAEEAPPLPTELSSSMAFRYSCLLLADSDGHGRSQICALRCLLTG
jgi:hypothetical protein